jgi:peptidoglycan/LPS O-acetylase OafA/YrhL
VRSAKGSEFHIPSLDGIRAVSFFIVFLAHAGLGAVVPGGFGVTVFFFLSGYLITTLMRMERSAYGRVSLKQFYLRRALRILPPFYLVLALACGAAASGVLPGGFSARAVAAQALHAANYWIVRHGYGGMPDGTGVYWSLAVEEHFYLVFPLLFIGLAGSVRSPARQAALLYALCGVVFAWRCFLVYGQHAPLDRTYVASDTRVDSILFGCALAVHGNPIIDGPSRIPEAVWKWVLCPLSVVVLLFTFVWRDPSFRETTRYTLQGIALTPVFTAAIRNPDWLVFRPLNTRLASFLGVLSYSLYLVHHSLLEVVRARVGFPPIAQASLTLLLSVGLAWTIYRAVEVPCAAIRRRLSRLPVIRS